MNILLDNAGKRFNRDWIFRSLDYQFISGKAYAIIGNNGSGKSTLLQCIGGAAAVSEGHCRWQHSADNTHQTVENVHKHLSIVAPYLEVIEEMTALEFLEFHRSFKPLLGGYTPKQVLETVQLKNALHKQIRNFSSGMKQRIKLAQALFSDVPVILLDEPCTNMDSAGFELYQDLINRYTRDRLVIVSSNDIQEYGFCDEKIDIRDYKKAPSKS